MHEKHLIFAIKIPIKLETCLKLQFYERTLDSSLRFLLNKRESLLPSILPSADF